MVPILPCIAAFINGVKPSWSAWFRSTPGTFAFFRIAAASPAAAAARISSPSSAASSAESCDCLTDGRLAAPAGASASAASLNEDGCFWCAAIFRRGHVGVPFGELLPELLALDWRARTRFGLPRAPLNELSCSCSARFPFIPQRAGRGRRTTTTLCASDEKNELNLTSANTTDAYAVWETKLQVLTSLTLG